ncbi:MAG: MFS transporter [Methanobacteriota archaeon]|nr:MAG: MFS transporter [Euryarchaeota archaeon]
MVWSRLRRRRIAWSPLWRHRDFLLLWGGQTVSRVGDQFTGLAVPYLAAYVLTAGPGEMGILGAAGTAPFLVFGLLVGVWVDRRQRRSVLIRADLGRGAMIGAIAVLGVAGLLHLTYLYVFSFFIGVLTVFFDVAYQAYLPSLVDRKLLVDANSKLEISNTLSGSVGPTVAGAVIQLFTAPIAMFLDAASFFVSAGSLAAVRVRETIKAAAPGVTILSQIREGLRVVVGDRRLRHIATCTAWGNFFSSAVFNALFFLLLKELGFEAFSLGILFGVSSIGGIVGAFVSGRISKRIGVGPAIILGAVLFSLPTIPLPFVTADLAIPVLSVILSVGLFGNLLYNINQVSFRQAIVPVRLQGRLNATMRTIVWGTLPLGALTGGFLGEVIGLRAAILVSVLAGAVSFLWVLFSPVRGIREIPEPAE